MFQAPECGFWYVPMNAGLMPDGGGLLCAGIVPGSGRIDLACLKRFGAKICAVLVRPFARGPYSGQSIIKTRGINPVKGAERLGTPMADQFDTTTDDGIAILRIANPPMNALSQDQRQDLVARITRALGQAEVRGIVLAGSQGRFATSADLTEAGPDAAPALSDLCSLIETSPKPVVAALEGAVFGHGFELALAAHRRVAVYSARFALGEIRVGLPPCAGATQRLPRLCGAEVALDILLSERVYAADQPQAAALIDQLADADPVPAAVEACRKMVAQPTRARNDGFADPMAFGAAVAKARKAQQTAPDPVKARIIDLIEASMMLPFEAGLAMEEDAYQDLRDTPRARALQHAVLAEQSAWRFDLPADTLVPAINTIAVLGAGPLALQIVLVALNAHLRVRWGARDPERIAESLGQLDHMLDQSVRSGIQAQAQKEQKRALLTTGDSAEMIPSADLVLHAARGQGAVPAPPGTLRAVAMAGRVKAFGLRFAMPVLSTRLIEVIHGPAGTAQQVASGIALAKMLRRVPVHVRSDGQSASDRLRDAQFRAADALLDAGADPYTIDAALRAAGWARPVFETRDIFGLADRTQHVRPEGAVDWAGRLVREGRTGRHEGLGFYIWGPDGPQPDIEVVELLDVGRPKQDWDAETILRLFIGAIANEGARMLGEGMVQRASDIDAIALLGLEFPRDLGGPMLAASEQGMFAVKRALEQFDHPDRGFWDPHPLWAERVKNGQVFV